MNATETVVNTKWFTASELVALECDGEPWLCEPFFKRVGLSGVVGASDCGKSTLMRQYAISIATKQSLFLGYQLNPVHGRAIYISTEDDKFSTKEVIEKQLTTLDNNRVENLHFLFDSDNIIQELSQFLSHTPVDVIIVDCFGDIYTDNPNNYVEVRKTLNKFKNIAEITSVVFIHHNVKNSENTGPDKNKVNGSQGLEAKLRSLLELRIGRRPDERLLTVLKANYLSENVKKQSIVLRLDAESLTFSPTNQTVNLEPAIAKRTPKYDCDLWLKRYDENREHSIEKTVAVLRSLYSTEAVPGKTWFVENLDSDGRSVKHTNATDRPKSAFFE